MKQPLNLLPNNDSLILGKVHLIGILYAKGLIPLGEVSGRHVCAKDRGTVNVYGKEHLLELGSRLLAPYSCPVGKILLKGHAFGIGHNVQGDRHTAVVGDVLADGELAVAHAPGQLDAVELLDHGVNLLIELPFVGLGPPVVDITVLVALCTVAIECV